MEKTKTAEFKLLQRIVQERSGLQTYNDRDTIQESVSHLSKISDKRTSSKQTKIKTKK